MEFKIKPFIELGKYLNLNKVPTNIVKQAELANGCFSEYYINRAVSAICESMLDEGKLRSWTKPYFNMSRKYESVAIIMAGNIPLVGFLDMMVCSICGVETYIKPSSKDRVLIEWVVDLLHQFGCDNISYYDDNKQIDSVIATGSNNANRYFNLKFGHLPAVRRGSRSSIAVITGKESREDINALWHDIFDYLGLGCRSVSHILVPKGYDIQKLCDVLAENRVDNINLRNSYLQNRALKIMNNEPFFDGGYFIGTLSSSLVPTMGEVTFSYNSNDNILIDNKDILQCVIGDNYIPFGMSQSPTLADWADDVNLFEFLLH